MGSKLERDWSQTKNQTKLEIYLFWIIFPFIAQKFQPTLKYIPAQTKYQGKVSTPNKKNPLT